MNKNKIIMHFVPIALAVSTCLLPVRASADAMIMACNEANVPVEMSLRIYGFGWEKRSLMPGECQNVRVSGLNLLFDLATVWHGAILSLNPQLNREDTRCRWKIDFGDTNWQRYAIQFEGNSVACVFTPQKQ